MTPLPARLLGVDLGGTKALCGLFEPASRPDSAPVPVIESRLPCADFDGLEPLLEAFASQARAAGVRCAPEAACIALAGPVEGESGRLTNLPWSVDARTIAAMLGGARVRLANDFEAAAVGIESLGATQLRSLQPGQPLADRPRAVIGPGTGLGVALLVPQGGEWRVLPGEGGHLGFAPRSELEVDLWRALHAIEPRVDYERVVCGPGLKAIYRFLRERSGLDARGGAMAAPDPAAAIAETAGGDPVAAQALDLFASVFGACAGDLALLANARGGVYLAGGIAPKVFDARRQVLFLQAFADKGSHARLMAAMPVSLVLEPRRGLLGAVSIAARSLGADRG